MRLGIIQKQNSRNCETPVSLKHHVQRALQWSRLLRSETPVNIGTQLDTTCDAGAPESPMSHVTLEPPALVRHSSGPEQQSLASMASPTPKEAQGLPGNLSPALPSPGSIFMMAPGGLGGPSLWSPAALSTHPDTQRTGIPAMSPVRQPVGTGPSGLVCTLHPWRCLSHVRLSWY